MYRKSEGGGDSMNIEIDILQVLISYALGMGTVVLYLILKDYSRLKKKEQKNG